MGDEAEMGAPFDANELGPWNLIRCAYALAVRNDGITGAMDDQGGAVDLSQLIVKLIFNVFHIIFKASKSRTRGPKRSHQVFNLLLFLWFPKELEG